MKARNEDDLKIAEKAAEWFYRLQEEDGTQRRPEFLAWLKHSPRHMQEFLMITAVSRELDAVDPERRLDVRELLGESADNLVPLRDKGPPLASGTRRRRFWNARLLAAAAITALCVLAGALLLWRNPPSYSTAIGEQRTVKLDDGSMMYLNARTRAKIQYTARARDLYLEEGEALFVVAHDAARPFRVIAGGTLVRAVGTRFNVVTRAHETTVSVVEGKVQVSVSTQPGRTDAPAPIELTAGEEAKVVETRGVLQRSTSDLAKTLAWRQRRLMFRDDTLADIVAEFNRYNRVPQFQVGNDEVGARRYTGTFDADDPLSLRQLLSKESDLMLENTEENIVIRARDTPPVL